MMKSSRTKSVESELEVLKRWGPWRAWPRIAALGAALVASACGSDHAGSTGSSSAAACGDGGGGVVSGPADTHCVEADGGAIVQVTHAAACYADAGSADAGGSSGGDDAAPAGPCYEGPGYGTTMYGSSGSDDDCKYDVSFTTSPEALCLGQKVSFVVTVTDRSTRMPLTGATVTPEIVSSDCNAVVIAPEKSTELGMGQYRVGPVVFGRAGLWVVRWHIDESCVDLTDDSPHGHAAFFLEVP